jgi:hypothetical protein
MSNRNHMLILIAIMAVCVYCLMFGESGKTLNREMCVKLNATRSQWVADEIAAGRLPPDHPRTLPCMASYQPAAAPASQPSMDEPSIEAAAEEDARKMKAAFAEFRRQHIEYLKREGIQQKASVEEGQ